MSPRNRILTTHKYTCTHTYTYWQIHLETCTLTKTLAHKLTYTQIVITDTGTCSEDSCKNKDTHICICGLFPSTGNNVYVLVQKQRKLIIANICICCQVMPWCANVPVFLDSPPPIHIDAHSRPQFSFCPFLFPVHVFAKILKKSLYLHSYWHILPFSQVFAINTNTISKDKTKR